MRDLQAVISILDPSDKFRPEKPDEEFRNYTDKGDFHDRVRKTYSDMHTYQTLESVSQKKEKWTKFDHAELTIMEALKSLDNLVDQSDPDCDIANSVHAFQTAERIREVHPDLDWFHLTGLIHDVGKIIAMWGEPQWCVVGDTFPLGCSFSDHIVFGRDSFRDNPDLHDSRYNTRLGIYTENCGLDKVTMSWGHDEYLYRVLRHNQCLLPEEAMYMIRFHSFYPWHTAGAYTHLTNDTDEKMLRWVKEFNKFDLYSKADEVPNAEELMPYYQGLIEKYMPGKLKW